MCTNSLHIGVLWIVTTSQDTTRVKIKISEVSTDFKEMKRLTLKA